MSVFSSSKQKDLKEATLRDNALQKLSETIQEDWPPHKHRLNGEVKAFWDFKDELSVYDDIVFRGERVVIPKSMQKFMIEKVHESDLGIVLCKHLARDVLFWPGMNKQIGEKVSKCGICQEHRNKLPKKHWFLVKFHPDRGLLFLVICGSLQV